MPEKKKGRGKNARLKVKAVVFPQLTAHQIINPFENVRKAKLERQKVYRRIIRNAPNKTGTHFTNIDRKSSPTIADVDEILLALHQEVYGEMKNRTADYPPSKKLSLIDGARLNQLPVEELLNVMVKIHKVKTSELTTESIAKCERDFFMKQLTLVENQLAKQKNINETAEREMEELAATGRHTAKVFNGKLKYTATESHERLLNERLGHVDLYVARQQSYWNSEKQHYEKLMSEQADSRYLLHQLDVMQWRIQMDGEANCELAKEDYLRCLRVSADALEAYMLDIQTEIDKAVQTYARGIEDIKRHNFDSLLQSQEKSISEMRKYFQTVNAANTSVIHQLKHDVNTKRAKLDRLEHDLCIALEDNAKVILPLQATEAEVSKYQALVQDADKVRAEHAVSWEKAKKLREYMQRLRWKKEVEQIKLEQAKATLQTLEDGYTKSKLEAARKAKLSLLLNDTACQALSRDLGIFQLCQMVVENSVTKGAQYAITKDAMIDQYFAGQQRTITEMRSRCIKIVEEYRELWRKVTESFESSTGTPFASLGYTILPIETAISEGIKFDHRDENVFRSDNSTLPFCQADALPMRTSFTPIIT